MRSTRPIAFVILLVVVVGLGAFGAGVWLGQQQNQNKQDAAVQDRSIDISPSNLPVFGTVVRRVVEQVYDDERQRSALTDDEAQVVLDGAVHWIERQILPAVDEATAAQLARSALTHVRSVIDAIRALK